MYGKMDKPTITQLEQNMRQLRGMELRGGHDRIGDLVRTVGMPGINLGNMMDDKMVRAVGSPNRLAARAGAGGLFADPLTSGSFNLADTLFNDLEARLFGSPNRLAARAGAGGLFAVNAEDCFNQMGLQNHLPKYHGSSSPLDSPSDVTRRFVKPCMDVKLGQCSYNRFALQEKREQQIRTIRSPEMGQILRSDRDALLRNNGANCDVKEAAGPAEPRSIKEGGWSTTLIPTTKDFWRNKQNEKDIYPVTKDNYRNRVALLITNIKFTLEELDRHGAEKDEENAEKLLTGLGYEVVKYTNLTAKAIDNAVIRFSKHPKLRGTDSVMVVIMSHGELGNILGVENSKSDSDEFPIDNIYKHLGPEKCPALLNKTKILIIQACRGVEKGAVLVSDSAAVPELSRSTLQHREKDFISLLSCTPGTKAYRHPVLGSLLIQFIVDKFNNHAYEDDIDELFRKVMQRFEEFCPLNIRQMPTKDRCTLTKRLYFYPGLNVV